MPLFRKSMLMLLLLALVVGGGAFYGMQSQQEAVVLDAAEQPAAEEAPAGVTVYVTGAVQQPGVVTVAAGARTADAVNACGGLLPQADAERVNMAQPVKDGQQIRVPEKKAAGNAATGDATGDAAAGREDGGLVNLNTADEKALDALPGVGPATARKIIEYRESEGGFQSTEDLMKIKGIGQAKYDKLKDKVTI